MQFPRSAKNSDKDIALNSRTFLLSVSLIIYSEIKGCFTNKFLSVDSFLFIKVLNEK